MAWGSSRWGKHRWSQNSDFYLAVLYAIMPGTKTIRVFFNHLVDNDDELKNPANWSLAPLVIPGVTVEVVSVTVEDAPQVTYIELGLSNELTSAVTYRLTVIPGKLSDFSYFINEPYNIVTFVPISDMLYVVKVTPVSNKRLEVLYSKEVDETVGLLDPVYYNLSPKIRVKKVYRTGRCKVLVELVSEMVVDTKYLLTVVPV